MHETFHRLEARMLRRSLQQAPALGGAQADRFFTQHVFAGFQCLDRSLNMEMVRHRVVDDIDVAIRKQFFVRAETLAP